MPDTRPTLASIAEEMAIEHMARARENAARAMEDKRAAERYRELARQYRGSESAQAVAS